MLQFPGPPVEGRLGPRTPRLKNADRPGIGGGDSGLDKALRQRYARLGTALLADDAPQRLDPTLRTEMETITGADLKDVRIHTGADARGMASSLGARAFATGSADVFFAQNQFDPTTPRGKSLLAHELTHVADGTTGMAGESRGPEREKLEMRARHVEEMVLAREQTQPSEPQKEQAAVQLPGTAPGSAGGPRTIQIDKAALEEKVWKLLERETKRQRERTGHL